MTELSLPWDGQVLGDSGPYTAEEWADGWGHLFTSKWYPSSSVSGILMEGSYLQVTCAGAVSPVSVAVGAAIVDGTLYSSNAIVTVAIPTPAAATRNDLIVLRKDWATQTVRIYRIAGVEGGGVPGAILTHGTTWDFTLAYVTVTTLGAITVTDQRLPVQYPTNHLYVPRRKGGDPVNWWVPGTISYDVNVKHVIQCGMISFAYDPPVTAGYEAISYPDAFYEKPIPFACYAGADVDTYVTIEVESFTNAQMKVRWVSPLIVSLARMDITWMAIGPMSW